MFTERAELSARIGEGECDYRIRAVRLLHFVTQTRLERSDEYRKRIRE